jgi:hypothetical protein
MSAAIGDVMTRAFKDLHVAVLMGGLSAEREVSLSSGEQCAQALERQGVRVSRVDAGRDLANVLSGLIKPDVVLNCLHGAWGEDGCVQGVLETLDPLHPFRACWPRPWRWTRTSPRRCCGRRASRCRAAAFMIATMSPAATSSTRPMWSSRTPKARPSASSWCARAPIGPSPRSASRAGPMANRSWSNPISPARNCASP